MFNLFAFKAAFKTTKYLKPYNLFEDSIKIAMYYAVAKGRKPGIYNTWDACKAQVDKFSGPIFKKFTTKQEAEEFISRNSGSSSNNKIFNAKKSKTISSFASSTRLNSSLKRCVSSDDELESNSVKRKKISDVAKSGFNVDENGYIEVFTDGACSGNGKNNAKAGIGVWFGDNHELNVSQPLNGEATNNKAEIQAVTVAANQATKAGIKKLKISTDSKFLISCITQWMKKWKRNGWKTADGRDVINKTELIEMENALKPIQIIWNHVRGHVGIRGNEMADKLARDGALRYKA